MYVVIHYPYAHHALVYNVLITPHAHVHKGLSNWLCCRPLLARKSPDLDFYASEQLISITNQSVNRICEKLASIFFELSGEAHECFPVFIL